MSSFINTIINQFQFASFAEFLRMGEHGLYIWLCYVFVLVVWLYLAFAPTWQTKQFIKQELKRQQRRDALAEER